MAVHNFDAKEPVDWPKVGEWAMFIELALVVQNKFCWTACDKAIVDMNGEDGDVSIVVGCEDSRVGIVDLEA